MNNEIENSTNMKSNSNEVNSNNNKNKLFNFSIGKIFFYACATLSVMATIGTFFLPQPISEVSRTLMYGCVGGLAATPYVMKFESYIKGYLLTKQIKKLEELSEGEPLKEVDLEMLKENESQTQNGKTLKNSLQKQMALNGNLTYTNTQLAKGKTVANYINNKEVQNEQNITSNQEKNI